MRLGTASAGVSCLDAIITGHMLQVQSIKEAGGQAQAVPCDVCSQQQQRDLFESHMKAYGSLDVAILNAGIGEKGAWCSWAA